MGLETERVSGSIVSASASRRFAAATATLLLLCAAGLALYAVTVLLVAGALDPASLAGGGRPPLIASIVATTALAVTLLPLHELARRHARRVLRYEPSSPEATLLRYAEEMAAGVPLEKALPRLAEIAATAVAAVEASIWVYVGEQLTRVAVWPAYLDAGPGTSQADPATEIPADHTTVELRHGDNLLGVLAVRLPAGVSLRPAETELLTALAADGALVVRNSALAARLQARISLGRRLAGEVRVSRRRMLEASQATRRQLERDIHDSSQQHVLALVLQLHEVRRLLASDPDLAARCVTELCASSERLADQLHSLAHDVYPPLLRSAGLAGALSAQLSTLSLPIQIDAAALGRYDEASERAVYFACLEAAANAAKHSGADQLRLRLRETMGQLRFEVSDLGVGFEMPEVPAADSGLAGIADRLQALGGSLRVQSTPGAGTTVAGAVPIAPAS